jgi:hypothetical protein
LERLYPAGDVHGVLKVHRHGFGLTLSELLTERFATRTASPTCLLTAGWRPARISGFYDAEPGVVLGCGSAEGVWGRLWG